MQGHTRSREGTRAFASASRLTSQTTEPQLPYAQQYTSPRVSFEATQGSQCSNTRHTSAPTDQHASHAALQSATACLAKAVIRDQGQAQLSKVTPSAVKYVPPCMRNRTEETLSASPVQQRRQPQQCEVQEFAVQLFPDMTSLTLLNKPPAIFDGRQPPDHHTHTAIHDYMAQICPEFDSDVWLDTFHTTIGKVYLPLHKVQQFEAQLTEAASGLPDVTSITYTATSLGQTRKDARINKDQKGDLFYHFKLTSAQLGTVLQPWIAALKSIARQLGTKFEAEFFSKHHMTIRCHTVAAVPESVYKAAVKAVEDNPVAMQVAGLRVQLPRSEAFRLIGESGVRTHCAPNGCKVRYPVPHYTSAAAASTVVERMWTSRMTTEGQADAAPSEGQAGAAFSEAAPQQSTQDQAHDDSRESSSGFNVVAVANSMNMLALQPDEACLVSVE